MEHSFVHRPNYLRSLPPILHLFSHPISPLDLPIMDDICPSAIGNWHEPKTRKCDSVLANDAEWHSSPCGSHLASMSFGFEPFHCNSKSIYSRDSKAILNQATGHPFVTVIAEDTCWGVLVSVFAFEFVFMFDNGIAQLFLRKRSLR